MKRIAAVAAFALFACAAFAQGSTQEPEEPKRAVLPVVLNILPGLGLGSFVQGDPLGGFVGLGGEVVGAGLLVFGGAYGYANLLGAIFAGMLGADTTMSAGNFQTGMYLAVGGAVLWTGTKVFEIARPIVYAKDWNEERGFASIGLAPGLRPSAAGFEPALVLKISY